MKLWEFNKLDKLPNYFLFYGDEFYLDFYFNTLQLEGDVLKLYFDEVNIDIAKSHISQNSLFGDKSTLIIKTDKWVDVEEIIKVVKNNYFYMFYYGDVKKVKTKPFKNNFVRFFKPDLKELIIKSNQYLKNKKIDVELLKYLISKVDYRFLFRELDKLVLVDKLNKSIIDKLVFNYNETSYDDLFDEFFTKKEYLKLETLLYQGNDEIAIISAFIRYVRNLYMFNLHIKNIGYDNVSKDVLGYQIPKHLEEIRKKIAFNIKEDKFLEILTILLKAELAMKSSKDKVSYLFKTFIEIKSLL
jgi:DNA polymerase-3 subunit delta